jgi:hypothetical protein
LWSFGGLRLLVKSVGGVGEEVFDLQELLYVEVVANSI